MGKVNNVFILCLLPGSYLVFIIVLISRKSSITDIKNAIISEKKVYGICVIFKIK
jgi:hypothetical protein